MTTRSSTTHSSSSLKSHTFVVEGAGEKDEAVNATVDERRKRPRPSYSYFAALPHFFPYLVHSYFIESLLHLESNWEFEMQLVYVVLTCPGTHMYLTCLTYNIFALTVRLRESLIHSCGKCIFYFRVDCSTSYIQLNLWTNSTFPFSSDDLKLDNFR